MNFFFFFEKKGVIFRLHVKENNLDDGAIFLSTT